MQEKDEMVIEGSLIGQPFIRTTEGIIELFSGDEIEYLGNKRVVINPHSAKEKFYTCI